MRSAAVPLLLTLFAVPALTASNGVAPAPAGVGAGTISGYTVSSISYSLDGDAVQAVSFELSPPRARTVRVRLAPDRPWAACTIAGAAVSCPLEMPLADAVALDVAAS